MLLLPHCVLIIEKCCICIDLLVLFVVLSIASVHQLSELLLVVERSFEHDFIHGVIA